MANKPRAEMVTYMKVSRRTIIDACDLFIEILTTVLGSCQGVLRPI